MFRSAVRAVGACLLLSAWCRWRGIALFERDGSLGPGTLAGGLLAAESSCIDLGLLALALRVERLRPLPWTDLACAFAAVLFALREGFADSGAGMTWRGDLLGLAAGARWGRTTVTIRATGLARLSAEKLLLPTSWP